MQNMPLSHANILTPRNREAAHTQYQNELLCAVCYTSVANLHKGYSMCEFLNLFPFVFMFEFWPSVFKNLSISGRGREYHL